ncbi:MAG: PP2C family protein-serine/threonine phosphatase [Candidatus Hydrogenedentes bacterium]|nr:PP2C family protein-serine/threonine phosphatase [Candidatus Hydrogenedentota bacterium]
MHREILDKQRVDQEIAYAWTIQEGFLVNDWSAKDGRFEVYGETRPARTVGGDFYDFVRLSQDRIGILIGDVSGKGVPAALAMAQLLAQFRLRARETMSPAEVVKALNEDLVVRSQRGMFCSLCYITLDLGTGAVLCANAGHHPVLYVGSEGARCFGDASGPPAGILPVVPWTDSEWVVEPGGTLLLYTDGIIEARSGEAGEEYGIEGLFRIARRMYDRPPKELVDAVNEDVRAFCAPLLPHDDCTMIAVRRLGTA